MDPYLEHRFSDHALFLKSIVADVIELSKVNVNVDKDEAREIAKKVQACLDNIQKPPSSPASDTEPLDSNPNPFQ
jgi:hypothetical protein